MEMLSEDLVNYSVSEDNVDKNIVTLVNGYLRCIKNRRCRSIKEMENAAYTVGLLVMITRCDDKSHEAYIDVFSAVCQGRLNPKLDTTKILECLAIVTFFGATDPSETEQAMQLLWTFIHPQSRSRPTVLTAAISAWSFLLSAIIDWIPSCELWKGATSLFSNLLINHNDGTVCAAAFDALVLIHETNVPENFSSCGKDSHGSVRENARKELENLIEQVRSRLSYIDSHPKRDLLTCSQIIQMKYMIHFLGEDGFAEHMNKNEKFHDLFNSIPETKNSSGSMLFAPEREEVKVVLCQSTLRIEKGCSSSNQRKLHKKMTRSSNSSLNKARTQLIKKKRTVLAQERGEGSWGLEGSY